MPTACWCGMLASPTFIPPLSWAAMMKYTIPSKIPLAKIPRATMAPTGWSGFGGPVRKIIASITVVLGANWQTGADDVPLSTPDWTEDDATAESYIENKPDPATQAEAQAGAESDIRQWSPLRVAQAVTSITNTLD